MMRVGDRLSMAMLVAVCGGTFVAVALTSSAKKANLIGGSPSKEGAQPSPVKDFDDRLKALERR